MRMKKAAALQLLNSELERVGLPPPSTFTVEDQPREEAETISWWHENTPANESSETQRNLGYLRAYLRIAGRDQLTARGIQLDRGRLWMDRSVISRLARDGFLTFVSGKFEPEFQLTEKGRFWIDGPVEEQN